MLHAIITASTHVKVGLLWSEAEIEGLTVAILCFSRNNKYIPVKTITVSLVKLYIDTIFLTFNSFLSQACHSQRGWEGHFNVDVTILEGLIYSSAFQKINFNMSIYKTTLLLNYWKCHLLLYTLRDVWKQDIKRVVLHLSNLKKSLIKIDDYIPSRK